ncbi:MAG: hypothetical protein KBA46_01510 [Candidatus Omnitrophica bacterium]|nr:hypothetical protein [Candidatus Omnitrophota bacterium]
MKRIILILLVMVVLIAISFTLLNNEQKISFSDLGEVFIKQVAVPIPEPEKIIPQRVGEKIVYDVRLGAASLGKAVFEYLPSVSLNNKNVNKMMFTTRLVRFSDIETIYSDPVSNLPIKVERYVGVWPQPEQIIEEYDQQAYTVNIYKKKGSKEQTLVFKREAPLHNAVLLPFFVRDIPDLAVGWTFQAQFPLDAYTISLVAIEDIKLSSGTFKAFRFESVPKKFEIWVSADEQRIPLKIKGASGIGYNLVMKEHQRPSPK